MEDGEIKMSPAIGEVINVSHKMFLILLLCLAMFSPDATNIESEIAQRMAGLEMVFECRYSNPHFKECQKKNNCLHEKITYL